MHLPQRETRVLIGGRVREVDPIHQQRNRRAVRAKVAASDAPPGREVVVRVHPDVARYLEGDGHEAVERLGALIDRTVTIQAIPSQPDREAYEIRVRAGGADAVQ